MQAAIISININQLTRVYIMSLQERVSQYKVGLISRSELQKFIDFANMGSDCYFYVYNDTTNKLER